MIPPFMLRAGLLMKPSTFRTCLLIAALSSAGSGCGDSQPATGSDGAGTRDAASDTGPAPDASADTGSGSDGPTDTCPRPPRAADGARKVAVSHPYGAGGQSASDFELLDLSADGALTTSGARFAMGHATQGRIQFTPDGKVGLLAQDDGSIGAFAVDPSGAARVIHQSFRGAFYASSIVMDPSGQKAYVLDTEWRNSGGGIYQIDIACDGTLVDRGLWAPAKLAYSMLLVPGNADRVAVAASDILSATMPGPNAFLLSRSPTPTLLGSVDAFGDNDAIVPDAALTPDGRFFLIADNNEFSAHSNRIAVVDLSVQPLRAVQVLSPLQDPVAVVPSPAGDALLVASGYGNALFVVGYHPEATPPFVVTGEVTYRGGRPQLPGPAVLIARGMLAGRVLVAETGGLRQVQFAGGGMVQDLGVTTIGSGSTALIGALGVQP